MVCAGAANKPTVSIPQAVSTIAIYNEYVKDAMKYLAVSIPQAVSTIAIARRWKEVHKAILVSIPQAVSTIAMTKVDAEEKGREVVFQYRKR